jgi:flagellin-specific chaperone FliS
MDREEKSNKKSDLSVKLSETEEIIGRLKEALNVRSDGELANNLGISRQNIGTGGIYDG